MDEKVKEYLRKEEIRCPVCFRLMYNQYKIVESSGNTSLWLHCFCGCIFNQNGVGDWKDIYQKGYRDAYEGRKRIGEKIQYVERVYIPFIEEVTTGRRFLDVGYTSRIFIDLMKKRGWVSTGIDLMSPCGDDTIQGDYETHDFGINKFDLIIMGDVLQCFKNPVMALQKAFRLLEPGGILMIWTPDTQIVGLIGGSSWGHWNSLEHNVYWSGDKLKDVSQRIGFDTLLFWRNLHPRFISTHNFHIILQKPLIRASIGNPLVEEEYNGENDKSGDTKPSADEHRGAGGNGSDIVDGSPKGSV